MKRRKDGVEYDWFPKGAYIHSDEGNVYEFLDPLSYHVKGMGILYHVKVKDKKNDRECFLKYAYYDTDGKANALINNLNRESRFQFYYPYIEHVFGAFSGTDPDGNRIYCVIVEFVGGKDLRQYCEEQEKQIHSGKLQEAEFEHRMFRHMMQILQGVNYYMNYAKEAYLHRDLKPENIMVLEIENEYGNISYGNILIVDFDFSHISESKNTIYCIPGWKLGMSCGYTDPRIYEKDTMDKLSDIYSLGRVFFFYLNRKDYFEEEDLVELKLPEKIIPKYCYNTELGFGLEKSRFLKKYQKETYSKLRDIIAKMCAKEEERYQDIRSIIKDMEAFLLEYCDNSEEKLKELLQTDKEVLLKERKNRHLEDAPYVRYQVVFPSGLKRTQSCSLYAYTMADIEVKDEQGNTKKVMTIYNIDGKVYYIPALNLKYLVRERSGDDFEIKENDIFETDDLKIQFFID